MERDFGRWPGAVGCGKMTPAATKRLAVRLPERAGCTARLGAKCHGNASAEEHPAAQHVNTPV